MFLRVVSVFSTMQCEGSKSGTPATFVRLSGCNLWSGHELLREKGKGVCANWCDTFFAKGKKYSVEELIQSIRKLSIKQKRKLVVITGGEPMLQLSKKSGIYLVKKLLEEEYYVAIETNGTIDGEVIDILYDHPKGHITMSPKPLKSNPTCLNHIVVRRGTDLKIVYPTEFNTKDLEKWNFDNFYLQPKAEKDKDHTWAAIHEAARIGWNVSVQLHKYLGLE